jgi:pSer/pThr/pTyr-binding forkhead associated (FHA) protein
MNVPDNSPVAKLTVSFEGKVLSVWEIPKGATRIIGRGTEVHYQIKAGALSRQHCQITDTGNGLEISDLGSRNGTFVNRNKIGKYFLQHGDQIEFGDLLIKVETIYGNEQKPADVPAVSKLEDESTSTLPKINDALPDEGAKKPVAAGVAENRANVSPDKPAATPERRNDFTVAKNVAAGMPKTIPPAGESPGKAPAENKAPAPLPIPAPPSPVVNKVNKPVSGRSKAASDLATAKRPLWEAELPSGNCQECGKPVTSQALVSFRGVYKGKQVYCIACFCKGAGNFPTIAGYRIVKN